MRIREAQKHKDPTDPDADADPDTQNCFLLIYGLKPPIPKLRINGSVQKKERKKTDEDVADMGRDSLPVLVAVSQQPVKLGRLLRDGFRHLVGIRHLPTHLWTTQDRDSRKASSFLETQ
jgi:hypothetical protein